MGQGVRHRTWDRDVRVRGREVDPTFGSYPRPRGERPTSSGTNTSQVPTSHLRSHSYPTPVKLSGVRERNKPFKGW